MLAVPVRMRKAVIAATVLATSACSGSSTSATSTTAATAPVTTTTAVATTPPGASTTVPVQDSGPRTVLSPVGLNVRAAPSKTAAVVGTAAEGSTLTVLSHTDQGGGFYHVRGATVTGYITDNPSLSAAGKFTPYSSNDHNFAALYPDTWSVTEAPPNAVVFRPKSGGDSIVVSTAATASKLDRGRAGYRQASSTVLVVCGVTGDLVIYMQSAPIGASSPPAAGAVILQRYLVQLHLTLDAQHALGVDANLADLAALQTVKDVLYSMSFPFPQCEQGATPNDSTTAPASTVP